MDKGTRTDTAGGDRILAKMLKTPPKPMKSKTNQADAGTKKTKTEHPARKP